MVPSAPTAGVEKMRSRVGNFHFTEPSSASAYSEWSCEPTYTVPSRATAAAPTTAPPVSRRQRGLGAPSGAASSVRARCADPPRYIACAGGASTMVTPAPSRAPPSAVPTTRPEWLISGSGGLTHSPRSQIREPLQSVSLRQPSGPSGCGQPGSEISRRRRGIRTRLRVYKPSGLKPQASRLQVLVAEAAAAEAGALALALLAALAAGGRCTLAGGAPARLALLALLALARLLVIAAPLELAQKTLIRHLALELANGPLHPALIHHHLERTPDSTAHPP